MNDTDHPPAPATAPRFELPDVRVPAGWTLSALAIGLVLGTALGPTVAGARLLALIAPLGTLWLRGLEMTIVPLVSALLVTGIVRTIAAAEAGAMARRTLAMIVAVLAGGTVMAAFATPLLLRLFPAPAEAAAALQSGIAAERPAAVPGLADFLQSLVPSNVFASAAAGAILPLIVFFSVFAVAITRLPSAQRASLSQLFEGLAGAMMVVIGWVLKLAPIGVFALSFAVAAQAGAAALGALAHYIALVSGIGAIVLLAAYAIAALAARQPLGRFARAVLPAQAVAISTQSSLASVPAMLASCKSLGLRDTSGEFVLPLAVALFRATGPAMNLAVAIYVAHLTGVELSAQAIAVGVAVALVTTLGAPSLPGAISFVSSIGPIALAMGVPIAPLALLVAIEVLPDIMRTVGNVTMDIALAATVDRSRRD